jgi:membrane associated rhomboid family serine protease
MFPLRDDNPTRRAPVVTYGLVALSGAVWLGVQGAGLDALRLEASICRFGAIPAEVLGQGRLDAGPCEAGGLTQGALVTSMFLHGGWFHLLGNLWFLWIFGNNVEDALGRWRFLGFYLVVGVLAAAAHVASDPGSPAPMVGASGAISGVMGAYLVLFPGARVKTLLFLLVYFTILDVPAWVYLLYWFGLQLAAGALAPGSGVAFWAHIGGFLVGAVALLPFRDRLRPDGTPVFR